MTAHVLTPEDADLLARFERRGLARPDWTHEMHVRIGWIHLLRWSFDEAMDRVRKSIRALNESNGVINDKSGGYHETMTRAWLTLIAAVRCEAADSAGFLKRSPEMLDKGLLLRFYSEESLGSVEAMQGWVEPDKLALAP